MNALQQPSPFLTGLALLAFVLGFCTLLAKERRTPYITTITLYWTSLLVLVAVLMSLVSPALSDISPGASVYSSRLSTLLLTVAVLNVMWRVVSLKNSHLAFRTDNVIKNFAPYRFIRRHYRSLRHRKPYEHNPTELSARLLDSLAKNSTLKLSALDLPLAAARILGGGRVYSLSIAYAVKSRAQSTELLVALAKECLAADAFVQYTTFGRHPVEFVAALKASSESWSATASSVVVVDAYTPHFGFTDTIHEEAKKLASTDGVHYVESPPSFAGVHTANARAFNLMKKAHGGSTRKAGLIIYEGANALADLESQEQYRVFVRHVAGSERLWGGMLTVFIEFSPSPDVTGLLMAQADVFHDLNESTAK